MGTLAANTSLIAPVDLVRFTLAYAAIAGIPGYAAAVLARPRADWIERAALAIPCACSLVALSGLATALLGLPFGLPAYGALALPIMLAASYDRWRKPATLVPGQWTGAEVLTRAPWGATPAGDFSRRSLPSDRSRRSLPCLFRRRQRAGGRWWLVPIGAAAAQVGVALMVYARHVMPSGSDVISHVMMTNTITRSHVYLALLSAHGYPAGGFYPPVFHALAALVLSVAPMATYRAVFFGVMAAIALLPLALFSYVRTVTGSARLGGLAALASVAFAPLPFFVLTEGFYPFILSLLFVPALAVALRDGLGRGDRRAVALAALLGVGLFYTHPTEFVTVALLALAVVPGLLRDARSWVRAGAFGALIAAVWGIIAIPALGPVHHTIAGSAQAEIHASHAFTSALHVDLGAVLGGYVYWVYGLNVSYALLAAVAVGALCCLVRRRLLGLVAAQAILFAVFVDANSYNVLRRFYALAYPWPLWERLIATHYWFALPLAAVGIDTTMRFAAQFLRTKQAAFSAIIAAPFVVIGLLVPLDVAGAHTAAYADARRVVAPADLGTLTWLARHARASSVVLNDEDASSAFFDAPIDAGLWMPALGGPQPLFWRGGTGPGSLDDRLYVLQHITDVPMPPRAARFIRRYPVRYIFYGAGVRPGATRHLNLARLLADARLRLVYTSAATCRGDRGHGPMACPATASYIFALSAPEPATKVHRGGQDIAQQESACSITLTVSSPQSQACPGRG